MKNKIFGFVLAICLIIPCLFVFAGCNEEENTNKLQLDMKYYREYSGGTYEIEYIRFTDNEMVHCKIDAEQTNEPIIHTYIYEYVDDEIICYVRNSDNHTYAYSLKISENFLINEDGNIYIAENYLIANNLPYVKNNF